MSCVASVWQVPQSGTLKLSHLQEGTYTFQLTVMDTAGQRSSDNVSVTVLRAAYSTGGEKKALPSLPTAYGRRRRWHRWCFVFWLCTPWALPLYFWLLLNERVFAKNTITKAGSLLFWA